MRTTISRVTTALFALSLCAVIGAFTWVEVTASADEPQEAAIEQSGEGVDLDIETVNAWLNDSSDLGYGSKANAVAIIPIKHVNGPREIDDFYAFVSYRYRARSYVKYQITYISCTCRSAEVNYWQTAYVELTLPKSRNIEDAEVRYISFGPDSSDHYNGGFWGDSSPTPGGATYDDFAREYLPFFVGKSKTYIDGLEFVEDIPLDDYTAGEGREDYNLDAFAGSSVSTNNIILMLQALMEFHGTDSHFQS